MREAKSVYFEPEIRVKMLREVVYPVIYLSSWQTAEKISALFRHKLRVERSIAGITDDAEREELHHRLGQLYTSYVELVRDSSPEAEVDAERCECAVAAEFARIEAEREAEEPEEQVCIEELSPTVKWLEARVSMLWATAVKSLYALPFSADEIDQLDRELSHIERSLAAEPATQLKAAILDEIELIRVLLLAE
jgi:hypothetical protein